MADAALSSGALKSALHAVLPMRPIGHRVDADIAVPGSKSITNRALLTGALADGDVTITGGLDADDSRYMADALRKLGFALETSPDRAVIRVRGLGGEIPAREADLSVGNAGTAMRFLAAVVCLGHGRYRLDGSAHMRRRPIGDLVDGLRELGVRARCELENGCPPVLIEAEGLPGGRIKVKGEHSSQYISAVLLAAPYARAPLEVEVTGEFVSKPFVELTRRVMEDFGVPTAKEGERLFRPAHGRRYRAGEYAVEGDATAATYFLAAAAILGGRVAVTNVRADSPQGDARFAGVLERMGCRVRRGFLPGGYGLEVSREPGSPLRAIAADLNDMPDTAQTAAAAALFAEGTTRLTNLANLRVKETDRLAALRAELTRLGARVEEGPDWIEIAPGERRAAVVETYDDHRMAMALALVGLGREGVAVRNPGCVSKTYPAYFRDLERLRGDA